MAREDRLFGDIVDPSIRLGSRRWYTMPLSIVVHTCALAVLVIVPLLATDVLPSPRAMLAFVPAPDLPPPPAAPPPAADPPSSRADAIPRDAAPVDAPDQIAPEAPLDTTIGNPAADGTGHPIGVPGGQGDVPGGDPFAPPPPSPPPPPPTPEPEEPVRPGGDIVAPAKTRDVPPRYPPIAQAAGIDGTVIIEATIGTDGRVQNARVLRSIPLLDEAALDAVRQWEYTPTLLGGRPVAVLMTVTVVFSLRR